MDKRIAYAVVGIGTALVVAAGIVVPHVVPSASAEAALPRGHYAVAAGTDTCGTGWPGTGTSTSTNTSTTTGTSTAPSASVPGGEQVFRITNTSTAGVEVQLEQPSTGKVFLDVEGLGTGASQTYRVRLENGRYRFRCLPADAETIIGSTVAVTGAAHVTDATPGIVPVTRNDLIPASKAYGDWIQGRLPTLEADVQALDADVHAGDVAAAERDWLTGHLEYEQLGAAYGAFGDDDTAINGMPASGTTALSDPDLTGFHKIEALLWSGAPTSSITAPADALVAAVQNLEATFPTARIDPLDIGLRSHEILENALQFEATGETDAGSHTNLATIGANVAGTQQALDPIRGILRSRYPDLAKTETALTSLQQLVASYRHADGTWEPLDQLTTTQRQDLNAHLDGALELLAPVAAICDIRRTS